MVLRDELDDDRGDVVGGAARKRPLVVGIAASLSVIAAPLQVYAQGAQRVTHKAAVKAFATPKQAADALLAAAATFDVGALQELLGPTLEDVVLPGYAL